MATFRSPANPIQMILPLRASLLLKQTAIRLRKCLLLPALPLPQIPRRPESDPLADFPSRTSPLKGTETDEPPATALRAPNAPSIEKKPQISPSQMVPA